VPEKDRGTDSNKDLQICGAGRKSRNKPKLVVGKNQMENPGSNEYFVSKPTKRAGATRQGEDK